MEYNFCMGCSNNNMTPICAISKAPNNAYIEDIINNNQLNMLENFVCHKMAQTIDAGKLNITPKCDDCGLCYIACPNSCCDYSTLFTNKLEKVVLNDYGKANILFQSIFPEATVATEVQVKGNFRTKRIDLVIKSGNNIHLIKLLKSTDKIPFYTRSYIEVIEQYQNNYPGITFSCACLIPASKADTTVPIDATILTLSSLYSLIRGN